MQSMEMSAQVSEKTNELHHTQSEDTMEQINEPMGSGGGVGTQDNTLGQSIIQEVEDEDQEMHTQ